MILSVVENLSPGFNASFNFCFFFVDIVDYYNHGKEVLFGEASPYRGLSDYNDVSCG